MNAAICPKPFSEAHAPAPGPFVEILDERGRTVAVMPETDARRQLLPHRTLAVLLYDAAGRLLLRRSDAAGPGRQPASAGKWDTPARGAAHCGEALREAALRILEGCLNGRAERPRHMLTLPPRHENGNEHLHIFALRLPPDFPHAPGPGEDEYAFAAEELACLLRDFRDLVSPRFLLLAGVLGFMPPRRTS